MNTREEELLVIKSKLDQLYDRIKRESEDDDGFLYYLANSAEVYFSGITVMKETDSGYEVCIDKYGVDDDYESLVVCKTKDRQEADYSHDQLISGFNLMPMWEDKNKDMSLAIGFRSEVDAYYES